MADSGGYAKYKNQKPEQNRANPSKFYTRFLYKAILVSILLAILPLFPSQAPDFINQNLHSRGWELLQIVFVGIAVSYGLFSHRNDETEKDNKDINNNQSNFDNAQNYVSRFLQVSSVFDEETENLSATDENKAQTWSNQYYRNEPVVVLAKDHSVLNQEQQQKNRNLRIGDRPLLLPVRSLKSRVVDSDVVYSGRESNDSFSALSKSSSNSGSQRFSGKDGVNLEDNLNENAVLPSPIPWRSRSGKLEVKEDVVSPSMEESDSNKLEWRSIKSPMPRLSRPNSSSSPLPSSKFPPSSSSSSPKKLSPTPSLSLESQAKNKEDFVRKKSFYRPPPPPPPPPPPAYVMHKSYSSKPNFSANNNDEISLKKELSRSYSSETNDSIKNRVTSVRTIGSSDPLMAGMKNKEVDYGNRIQSEKVGSNKTVTFSQTSFMTNPSYMEFPQQGQDAYVDKLVVEADVDSESEEDYSDDNGGCRPNIVTETERGSNNEEAGGPDVDKKADEFIAKFREQIRLQRIESIKRSSAQMSRRR